MVSEEEHADCNNIDMAREYTFRGGGADGGGNHSPGLFRCLSFCPSLTNRRAKSNPDDCRVREKIRLLATTNGDVLLVSYPDGRNRTRDMLLIVIKLCSSLFAISGTN